MTIRRGLPVCAAIAALLGGLPPNAAAQDAPERPTFSTSVALVPITAVVRDSKGRIVRGLARDDFQVLENSQPRRILEFRATADGPISIGLLFDTSGSMRGTALQRARSVVDRLLTLINPTSDEIALFTFDKTLRQHTPFVAETSAIQGALDESHTWGTTSLYDAIADAARRVSDRATGRRALVVITDGLDTSSALTPAEVSALASGTDVPVYVLPVYTPRRQATSTATGDLADLATWTGGDLLPATAAVEMDRAVASLITELRQQYFLAIESSSTAGWYRLDVSTRRRDLNVRTRGGYFGASDPRIP